MFGKKKKEPGVVSVVSTSAVFISSGSVLPLGWSRQEPPEEQERRLKSYRQQQREFAEFLKWKKAKKEAEEEKPSVADPIRLIDLE